MFLLLEVRLRTRRRYIELNLQYRAIQSVKRVLKYIRKSRDLSAEISRGYLPKLASWAATAEVPRVIAICDVTCQ